MGAEERENLEEVYEKDAGVVEVQEKGAPIAAWISNAILAIFLMGIIFARTACGQGVQQIVGHVADPSGAVAEVLRYKK